MHHLILLYVLCAFTAIKEMAVKMTKPGRQFMAMIWLVPIVVST